MEKRGRTIVKLLLSVTGVNALVAGLAWVLMTVVWPDTWFATFPWIPAFFWVVALAMVLVLEATYRVKPQSVAMTYMMARGVKLLLTAIFVGSYAWLVHTDMKLFGLTTLVYYMLFLVLESCVFYAFEQRQIKRRRSEVGETAPHPGSGAGKEMEHEAMDV